MGGWRSAVESLGGAASRRRSQLTGVRSLPTISYNSASRAFRSYFARRRPPRSTALAGLLFDKSFTGWLVAAFCEHLPRRGWQLRPFRQADLDAYIDMRVTLELKALDLAWPRLVDEELQAILDGNRLPAKPDGSANQRQLVARLSNREIQESVHRRFL